MNKGELIKKVATDAGLTNKQAEAAINAAIAAVSDELAAGNTVQLLGFGTFDVRTRAARTGRNPQTGETVEIPAGKSVGFKAGKALKDRVK